jgi:putative redox protein
VEATVTFVGPLPQLELAAVSGSGLPVTMDTNLSQPRHGPSPREMVLIGLGGCTAMDVAEILNKKRQPPTTYRVKVTSTEAEAHPQVFTAITVEHIVTGEVELEALRRSIELSATRYCPVSRMLSATVPIEHRYRLTRPGESEISGLVVVTGPPSG